jgi:hypothetical protein
VLINASNTVYNVFENYKKQTSDSLLRDNEVRKWSRMHIINLTVDRKIISEVENNMKTECTMVGPLTRAIHMLWRKERERKTNECAKYSAKLNFKISESS